MKNGKTSLILPVLIIVAVASLALFWWLAPLRNVSSGREAAHSGETSRSLSLSERWLRDERKRAIAMAVQALVEKGTWNDTTELALNADPLAREAAVECLEWLEMEPLNSSTGPSLGLAIGGPAGFRKVLQKIDSGHYGEKTFAAMGALFGNLYVNPTRAVTLDLIVAARANLKEPKKLLEYLRGLTVAPDPRAAHELIRFVEQGDLVADPHLLQTLCDMAKICESIDRRLLMPFGQACLKGVKGPDLQYIASSLVSGGHILPLELILKLPAPTHESDLCRMILALEPYDKVPEGKKQLDLVWDQAKDKDRLKSMVASLAKERTQGIEPFNWTLEQCADIMAGVDPRWMEPDAVRIAERRLSYLPREAVEDAYEKRSAHTDPRIRKWTRFRLDLFRADGVCVEAILRQDADAVYNSGKYAERIFEDFMALRNRLRLGLWPELKPEDLAAALSPNASLPDFANIILLLSRGDPEAVLKALPEPPLENGAAVKGDALAALRAYLRQVVTCRKAVEKGELWVGEEVFKQPDPEALRSARSALGDLFFAGAGSRVRKLRELPKPFQSLANKGARLQEKGSNEDF